MALFTIVYVSSAAAPMRWPELDALVQQAARHNEQAGISGMLIYADGDFMQVLEGEETEVTALYGRIQKDRRHRGLITLVQEHIEQPEFRGWALGFENLDPAARCANWDEAISSYFAHPDNQHASRGRSYQLLAGFRRRFQATRFCVYP